MHAPPLDPAHRVDDAASVGQLQLQVQASDPADVAGERSSLVAEASVAAEMRVWIRSPDGAGTQQAHQQSTSGWAEAVMRPIPRLD
jgi:hypothetical protein